MLLLHSSRGCCEAHGPSADKTEMRAATQGPCSGRGKHRDSFSKEARGSSSLQFGALYACWARIRAHPTAPLRPCGPARAAPLYTSWRCLKAALWHTAVRRLWGAAIHASLELRACPGPPHFPFAPPAHGPSPVPPAAFGVRCPSGNGSREMKSNVINYYFYSVFMDGWK